MASFGKGPAPRFETYAALDYGDHGMGATRQDPARVGLIELTDRMRWVPSEGEGWDVPIASVTVLTRKTLLNRPSTGVEIEAPELGTVRVRGMAFPPGVPLAASQAFMGEARKSGMLLKELLARGAKDGSDAAQAR